MIGSFEALGVGHNVSLVLAMNNSLGFRLGLVVHIRIG